MIGNSLKIAFRNVLRNKRRTLITLSAIVVGTMSIIFVAGYMEFTFWGLRESTIRGQLGHLQIAKASFFSVNTLEADQYLMDKKEFEFIETELKRHPEIMETAKRLSVSGLIVRNDKSTVAVGFGVEPDNDAVISTSIKYVKGSQLTDEDQNKILIGTEMAKQLQLDIGDTVTLLANTLSGSINALDFEIKGIISVGIKEMDEKLIRLSLKDSQTLLSTDQADRLVVLLDKTDHTSLVYQSLKKAFSTQNLEVKTWDQLSNYYFQLKNMYGRIFVFLSVIVLIIIILGIANTMMMAVMERTSEIGTIRALGTSRRQVILLFIAESFYIGIIGGGLGVVCGTILALIINFSGGIYMPPPPGHTTGYSISILLSIKNTLFAFLIPAFASTLSGCFPAVKAAQIQVVEALRHS